VGSELDVPRLQVPMDDAPIVGSLEAVGELAYDVDRLRDRKRPARQARRQGLARRQLQHETVHPRQLLEAVDRTDPRVVERRQQAGLSLEAGEAGGVPGERLRPALDP